MDVARYADTKGYVFNEDRNYYSAYTYRDWLINSFNQDLPYDKFLMEQLAADRLQTGDDRRPLAALGYLTLGRRFINVAPDIIDDRIDVTMRGMEGLTVGCARCHDHKFDPIPTQDYYSLYAIFASSNENQVAISPKAVREPWEQYNQRVAAADASVHDLVLSQTKTIRERAASLTNDERQALQSVPVGQAPDGENLKKLMPAFDAPERDRYARLESALTEVKKNPPPTPEFAMAMSDSAHPSDGRVFHHGNPGNPGDVAPRRFLLALSKPGVEREHWTDGSGRLELAQAIASKDNPLTARVYVNRVWQDHFGQGIVRTPSDFGNQGEKPTHPELLDYLASAFMESGWSIKKLHRLIVTSATYQESSEASKDIATSDPENRLWSHANRRRLDLEEMHDAVLSAASRLDLATLGGKSVDLWAPPFAPRRAVYGFIERQNLPGIFRTFDFASPDTTNGKRFQTTVPQQALFFMNSPFAVEQARSLASRKEIKEATSEAQRIRRLYRILFDRMPTAEEAAIGQKYLSRNPGLAPSPTSLWRYGYGGYDSATKSVAFTPDAEFSEPGYHPTKAFPDPTLGYLLVNVVGGHPGRDASHATIRRWVSPGSFTVSISAVLKHPRPEGDGVRARIVSSRTGLLGEWTAHHSESKTNMTSIVVQKGDTIDFIVDPISNDGFDGFEWNPTLRAADGSQSWVASAAFGPPPPPGVDRVTLYAQALMMTNEFMFVD
jgi:hypothetical protein